jgi:hypothetical protein
VSHDAENSEESDLLGKHDVIGVFVNYFGFLKFKRLGQRGSSSSGRNLTPQRPDFDEQFRCDSGSARKPFTSCSPSIQRAGVVMSADGGYMGIEANVEFTAANFFTTNQSSTYVVAASET